MTSAAGVAVLGPDQGPLLPLVDGGTARAVVWPGMGARLRSMHFVAIPPRGETTAMRHPGEAVYYVISGGGEALDLDRREAHRIGEGSMVHLEPATSYRLRASDSALELVGGPAPADPSLYERITP